MANIDVSPYSLASIVVTVACNRYFMTARVYGTEWVWETMGHRVFMAVVLFGKPVV